MMKKLNRKQKSDNLFLATFKYIVLFLIALTLTSNTSSSKIFFNLLIFFLLYYILAKTCGKHGVFFIY